MKFQSRNNYIVNWPEYPLLRVTICFIIGIYLSDAFSIPLAYNLYGIVILFLALTSLHYFKSVKSLTVIRIFSLLILGLVISIGVFRGNLKKTLYHPNHFSKHINGQNLLIGKISAELKHKKRISTTIEVSDVDGQKCVGTLLVYFSAVDSSLVYQVGDVIAIMGTVQALQDNANPSAFNYKDHLKYKGIDYHLFLKEGAHVIVEKSKTNTLYGYAQKIRKWALGIFEKRLKDRDQLATASAMVLGYRDFLDAELYTSFSETGSVHVLAVSGLHVGIICMIFIWLFDRFKSEKQVYKAVKLLTLLSIVWSYTLVTGCSPAVLRAAVMFSFILIGKLWFRGVNIYNILSFSALVLLMYDPYLLFQLSFQFSYLALISIVFFQPRIENSFETKHKFTSKIWKLTSVSIAAQILIFPISIFYFNKFPSYFIVSGIIAVCMATYILGIGLCVLLVDKAPYVGDTLAEVYKHLLDFFISCIQTIHGLPFNTVQDIYISRTSLILFYILILTIMYLLSLKPSGYKDILVQKMKRRKIAFKVIALSSILLMANSIWYTYSTKQFTELIVYDISKGTSIDLFCGSNLYSKNSNDIDVQKIEFASASYRILRNNTKAKSLDLSSESKTPYFELVGNGTMIYKNKCLVFVDHLLPENSFPCESDIVFVVNKTDFLPYDFLQAHHTTLVVLDNSLSYKIKNQWRKECKKRNIKLHDIRKDGVFRF